MHGRDCCLHSEGRGLWGRDDFPDQVWLLEHEFHGRILVVALLKRRPLCHLFGEILLPDLLIRRREDQSMTAVALVACDDCRSNSLAHASQHSMLDRKTC